MKIWQITCGCGQSLPVAMHQCGLSIACPRCHAEVVVPSSMELRNLPGNVDGHGQIVTSSGELVRVDSPILCNQFRARLKLSNDIFYRASNYFVVSQSVAGTVALSLSDGLSETQVLTILDEILPSLKVSKSSQEILTAAKAMQQDAAGMWLKRVWFAPFKSGWLGGVHVLITAVLATTLGLYLLVQYSLTPKPGRTTMPTLIILTVIIGGAAAYYTLVGRILFRLFHKQRIGHGQSSE